MVLVFDTMKCTGCRSCEIACSFHHSRVFRPERASLKVYRNERAPDITITLYRDPLKAGIENRPACDDCQGEPVPLCSKYCAPRAITVTDQIWGRQ